MTGTFASETLPLNEVADAGYSLETQIKEIISLNDLPQIRCIADSKSLLDTTM